MSIDPTLFKIRFPEFIGQTDERIQIFIDDAIIVINENFWGEKYNLGLNYLTAHYLVSAIKSEAGSSGSIGGISGKSVDGVSVSYAKVQIKDSAEDFVASTIYGQRYLTLKKTLGVTACVI